MQSATVVAEESKAEVHRTRVALLAWLGMLLLSRLPQVITQELLNLDFGDAWLWFWLVTGVALIGLTFLWPSVRPLRGFFLVLTTIYALTLLLNALTATTVWQGWFAGEDTPWAWSFFAERLVVVLLALGVIAVLLLTGNSRRDLYLANGNWRAPTSLRLPGRDKPLTWLVLGPILAVLLTLLIGAAVFAFAGPDSLNWRQLLDLSPLILLFALMNAFGEEVAFRAGPMSQLVAPVGERHALWLPAVWFALGHYYGGIPSGPVGVIFLTAISLIFGRAMLATKGITLPIFMHMLGDIVVYSVLAMAV